MIRVGRLYAHIGYIIHTDASGFFIGWRLKDVSHLKPGQIQSLWHIEFSCNLPRICRFYDRVCYWSKYDSSKWTGRAGEIVGLRWERYFYARWYGAS